MAATPYDAFDPTGAAGWEDQVRQQILAQQQLGAEPQVTPTPAAEPSTTSPDYAEPPAAAPAYPQNPSPAGVGDPGNDANQIQGWASKFLGRNFSDADISGLAGQPLDVVQHNIANSPEAQAYARSQAAKTTPAAAPSTPLGSAYGLTNGYASMPGGDANAAWKDAIRQIITRRLAADQGPVDEQSPQIQAALTASRDAFSRQNTQERDALAERLYAQGGTNTDAITQQIQQSNERTGTAQSSLRAQLLTSAYKDKFTELNHLLDLATQTGDTEEARQIQVTLANLQAAVAREGIGANLSEFGAQLGQNAALAGLNG